MQSCNEGDIMSIPRQEVEMIPADEVLRMAKIKSGPFIDGLTVACPMRHFARRKTKNCDGCDYLAGACKRQNTFPNQDTEAVAASRTFQIFCAHPISRSLEICMEN